MPDWKFRPIPEMSPEKIEKFWAKVQVGDPKECWPWLGYRDDKMGYGYFAFGNRNRLAHRVSFFIFNGRDTELCVMHKCDNPPCCNPYHFTEGTHEENNWDRHRKGRNKSGPQNNENHIRGEAHRSAKLNPDKVREIRRRATNGETHRALGIEFGIAHRNITKVVHRVNWKHVD